MKNLPYYPLDRILVHRRITPNTKFASTYLSTHIHIYIKEQTADVSIMPMFASQRKISQGNKNV